MPSGGRVAGGLGGLGDLGDTGIPALDAVISTAEAKIDRLVLATEIGTAAALIGAAIGIMLLFGGPRR
jgi:hypothetical protein